MPEAFFSFSRHLAPRCCLLRTTTWTTWTTLRFTFYGHLLRRLASKWHLLESLSRRAGAWSRPGPGGHRRRSSQTLGAGAGLSGRSDLNGEEAKNPPKRGQKGQKGVGRWEGGRMKVPGACCWLLGLVCLSQVRGFFVIGWQMLFSVKRQRVFHTICERG